MSIEYIVLLWLCASLFFIALIGLIAGELEKVGRRIRDLERAHENYINRKEP